MDGMPILNIVDSNCWIDRLSYRCWKEGLEGFAGWRVGWVFEKRVVLQFLG